MPPHRNNFIQKRPGRKSAVRYGPAPAVKSAHLDRKKLGGMCLKTLSLTWRERFYLNRKTVAIMEKQQVVLSRGRLSPQEVTHYRQRLAELDRKAHEPGGDPSRCENTVWRFFNPPTLTGIQIYKSFSDDELLDIVIQTMGHQGHRPDFDSIYCVYLNYLKMRFGTQNEIKARAKDRMKQLKNERDWPFDWQKRVSVEKVLVQQRKKVTAEDAVLLEKLCARAKAHSVPVEMSPEEKEQLNHLGGCGNVLKMMGIPNFRGKDLQHMQQFWKTERRERMKQSAAKKEN